MKQHMAGPHLLMTPISTPGALGQLGRRHCACRRSGPVRDQLRERECWPGSDCRGQSLRRRSAFAGAPQVLGAILAGVIDVSWIDYWADHYPVNADSEVLNEVGARVRERGHYDRQDFIRVGVWKSQRAKSRMASNSDEMIHDITATALTAPLAIQHRILTLLKGVEVPMASSLLTVWQPEVHTVIDVRAVNSLVKNQEIPVPGDKYPPYMEYLTVCKAISQRCCRISESWTAPYTPRTDALSCRAPPSLQLDSLGNTIRACTKLALHD